ncbi:MAG: cbb3-type cytochrome c oxidase N-terminal domain-containing protein [bacterium]
MIILLVYAPDSMAQQVKDTGEMDMNAYSNVILILFFILVNVVFLVLLFPPKSEEELALEPSSEKKASLIKRLKDKLSGLQPIETEKSLLLEDDYDGIHELDNNVPPWFNILFYGTIVIAIIYMLNYHVFKIGKLPLQEYMEEVYIAGQQKEELIRTGAYINENTVVALKDNESLTTGKQIFLTNCVTCHGENAQGTVGPNLTDPFWIHGGGIKKVFATIKYGVPAKGMITWQNQFNPKMIQQVASYVISLQGTEPLYGKIPEGEKYAESPDSTGLTNDSTKTGINKKDSAMTDEVKLKK